MSAASGFARPVEPDDDDVHGRAAPLLLLARRREEAQLLGSDRKQVAQAENRMHTIKAIMVATLGS